MCKGLWRCLVGRIERSVRGTLSDEPSEFMISTFTDKEAESFLSVTERRAKTRPI
jgi:hypothetical protein